MTGIDFILDGLESALELERELGVRTVECDRTLLAVPSPTPTPSPMPSPSSKPTPTSTPSPASTPASIPASTPKYDFVFLHDRPLSAAGIEMMAKIVTAMKRTAATAPVVFTGDKPSARFYVVLGQSALRKWYPDLRGAFGQWQRAGGDEVLLTYSPEYILRFGVVTPAVEKIKREMWTSLKGVMQRLV